MLYNIYRIFTEGIVMEFLEKVKEFFINFKDRLMVMDRYDYYPLNRKFSTYEKKNIAILLGIYLVALFLFLLCFIMLGGIAIAGVLFKIIGVVGCIYSLGGVIAVLYDITQNF